MKGSRFMLTLGAVFFIFCFTSCKEGSSIMFGDGTVHTEKIPDTPKPGPNGWTIPEGSKKYILTNASSHKKITFTLKFKVIMNKTLKEEKTLKYTLNPGEFREVGITKLTNPSNGQSKVVKSIKVVGELEL